LFSRFKNFIQQITFFILVALLTGSCSVERKLARDFIGQQDSIAVMLMLPEYVIKTNNKAWEIPDFENLSEWEQDSALYENSTFVREIDDDFLLSRFQSSLQIGLRKYGILAYTEEQLIDFMSLEQTAYKVMLAQVEVEEDIFPYRAEEVFDDTAVYFEDFDLNIVSINTWFEITKVNDPAMGNNVVYASHYVMDGLDGRFLSNLFSGEVKFHYNLYPVEKENVYTLAARLGEKYAGYLYDYMLNEYIHRNNPDDRRPGTYFSYNPLTRTLSPARDDRFIFMEQ